jgi:hypothetical protein
MAQDPRKSELIAELARARSEITRSSGGLRRELSVKRRLASAFRRHSMAWLAGAGLLGALLTRLPGRSKKVVVTPFSRKAGTEEKVMKAGLLITVLKIVFDLVRPALTKWLTRRVVTYAEQRFSPRPVR